MQKDELMLKVENVSKVYRLGEIGGTTLRDELQRLGAKIRHKEDPTKKIGAKNYNKGEKFKALDNISFEVKKGERIGIIGHNGAGKSTLLKLISRVTGPTDGKIYLNGRVASMLEVGTGFHPELTGRENVYMNGAILGMTKKEIDAKMEDIIEFSEVRQFIDTPVKRYSSGMYVKLAFSVAAHLDSEIMIMDEVLAVGDMAFQNKCLAKMRDVSERDDKTILYVSHNMSTIRQLCDKIVVLDHGSIVFIGDVEKGIEKYLNSNVSVSTFVDMRNLKRNMIRKQKVNMLNIRYADETKLSFHRFEKAVFFLKWESLIDCRDVLLRLIIQNSNGYIIGTSISECCKVSKEHSVVNSKISFDTSLLAEGTYFLSLSLIQKDNNGNRVVLDNVTNVLSLKVTDDANSKDNYNDWNAVGFGSIHYCGVEVESRVYDNESIQRKN